MIPQHFQAHSYVGETFITLSWQHVADNGTRRGYKVLYRKVSDAGSSVNDTDIEGMLSFPADTTTAMVHGLDRYSKYCFRLLVFNQNFDGVPSSSVCAGKLGLCYIFIIGCWSRSGARVFLGFGFGNSWVSYFIVH